VGYESCHRLDAAGCGDGAVGTKLLLLATVRQVFSSYKANGTLKEFDSSAYTVPLAGGPQLQFCRGEDLGRTCWVCP
jgi:hypothetical protein